MDVFQNSSENTSFAEMWPQLRDRILTLSQAVVLLWSSFGLSSRTTSSDIGNRMMELGMLHDAVCGGEDITDVPLRSCWEGIRFVNQILTDFSSATLPLLTVKLNDQKNKMEIGSLQLLVGGLRRYLQGVVSSVNTVEAECVSHFTRYD